MSGWVLGSPAGLRPVPESPSSSENVMGDTFEPDPFIVVAVKEDSRQYGQMSEKLSGFVLTVRSESESPYVRLF